MIACNFLVNSLRPSQTDVCLIQQLNQLDSTKYSGQIFCVSVPNAPIQAAIPILPMYVFNNLRHDKNLPCFNFILHWTLIDVVRRLANQRHNRYTYNYVYCNCPEFLYPSERGNFIHIVNAYKSEFHTITSCDTYAKMLVGLGCIVESRLIDNFNIKELTNFMEERI